MRTARPIEPPLSVAPIRAIERGFNISLMLPTPVTPPVSCLIEE